MTNSIVWGPSGANFLLENAGMLNGSYSILSFDLEGEGNLNADPLFVDPMNGDFSLQPDSPAIDAGDPEGARDPDSTRADMGAFFYYQNQSPYQINTLDDIALIAGADVFEANLTDFFADPENDPLIYSAVSADSLIAQAIVVADTQC